MKSFIKNLEQKGLLLKVKEGDLILSGVNGKLSADEIREIKNDKHIPEYIKTHKKELIRYLIENEVTYQIPSTKSGQITAIYPLSPLQEGILFHCLYHKTKNTTYITQFELEFQRGLNVAALKRAWDFVIRQHTILRTSFIYDRVNVPLQCVFQNIDLPFYQIDFRHFSDPEKQNQLKAFLLEDRKKGFDLTKPPLTRITLVRMSDDSYKMIWTKHHILWDGWSGQVLFSEVLAAYEKYVNNETPIPTEEDRFEDYIKLINKKDKKDEQNFWSSYFKGFEEPSLLPFIKDDLNRNKGTGDIEEQLLVFEGKKSHKLIQFSKTYHITINTLVQGVWALLLSKYTNKDDVTYGVTVSGRPADIKYDKKVGLYINTLPLRAQIVPDQSIREWLLSLQQEQVKTREYQYSSLAQIQKWGQIEGDFFDNILVFRNFPVSKMTKKTDNALKVTSLKVKENNNYPLSIQASFREKLSVEFKYNQDLLNKADVERMLGHFEQVLLQMIENPNLSLSALDILTPLEKSQIVTTFNKTDFDFPKNTTILNIIEDQVKRFPHKEIVVYDNETLSYQTLNERANRLGNYLVKGGIKEEAVVGICVERSLEMIIGILAILKAGGAYLPIDPTFPSDRIKFILEDSGVQTLLTSEKYAVKLRELDHSMELVVLDEKQPPFESESSDSTTVDLRPTNLAYVIYTSGSTGKPKGVMNQHSGLLNRLLWTQDYFKLQPDDAILQKTTFCFDVSVWELLWPLIAGCKLVFAKPDLHKDNQYLKATIEAHKITTIHFVPSMLEVFLIDIEKGACASLKRVICSGEALKPIHVNAFKEHLGHVELYNLYGPTEAAIDVTAWKVPIHNDNSSTIPIGKPVANTQLYILDNCGHVQPIGVAGELFIAGNQVARGYLNRPQLTNERFVKNPFTEKEALMYKTGDLARWLPDGNIEFLGRSDFQVKIRGFRIELKEIESIILKTALVAQCVTIANEDDFGNKRLVAFVVPTEKYEKEHLLEQVRNSLPDYMVPSLIVPVNNIPLTHNGKIDRKALLNSQKINFTSSTDFQAPSNKTEQQIAKVWQELLGIDTIGIKDNFFSLGGDSIILIRAVSRINKLLDTNLDIQSFYQFPNIESIAALLDKDSENHSKKEALRKDIIDQIKTLKKEVLPLLENNSSVEEVYPMSDIQRGMVYESLKDLSKAIYHDQFVYRIPFVDTDLFVKAFKLLIRKHSILRTSFEVNRFREDLQVIYQAIDCPLDIHDLTYKPSESQEEYIRNFLIEERKKPFQINKAPLWRYAIFKIDEENMIFIFQFHHAILDGWSVASLNAELYDVYLKLKEDPTHEPLPLKTDFKECVIEEKLEQLNEEIKNNWRQDLLGYKRLNLFKDEENHQKYRKVYDPKYLDKIKAFAESQQLSIKTVFLAAHAYALSMLTYENEVTLGLVSNTRIGSEDGDKVLGCFLNTVPLRLEMPGNKATWKEYLIALSNKTNNLSGRSRLTLHEISKVCEENQKDNNPFFDVIFNFVNFHVYDTFQESMGTLEQQPSFELESYESTNTLLDITVSVTNGLRVSYKLKRELYSEVSLEEFHRFFEQVLDKLVFNWEDKIDHGHILSSEMKHSLLNQFNATDRNYQTNLHLVELFDQQVKRAPNRTALVYEGKSLTFNELNQQSSRVANLLIQKGVKTSSRVGICINRSLEMIIGILGVLKSGAAYVPIGPDYPIDRVKFILQDTAARIILTNKDTKQRLENIHGISTIVLDNNLQLLSRFSDELAVERNDADLAYIIYTSGSTGKPKGVMVPHAGVANRLLWGQEAYQLKAEDVVLQKTNFTFDVSVWEIFWPLITGAKLVLAQPGGHRDNNYLKNIIREENITTIHFVPSLLATFLPTIKQGVFKSLKRVFCSGEALKQDHVLEFKKQLPGIELYNLYGPTEASIEVSAWQMPESFTIQDQVTIGQPIANTQLYVLNNRKQLMPIGVPGELCIGGIQVAKGYLNRPDLTRIDLLRCNFKMKEVKYFTEQET